MMDSDLPSISIVTVSLNQTKFVEEAIKSIIDQKYPKLEFIIIDGGSTDGSVEIIESYQDQLAYWISEKDHGQSHAINKGFQHCHGDLVTFLNSDDLYLPGAFKFAAEKYQTNYDCGAIVGGFYFIDENEQMAKEANLPRLPYPSPLDLTLIPPESWRLHQVSTFYTRHALDQVGRYVREDLHYVMDRELLFRVAKDFEIILDDRPYAAFRRHPESKSMSAGIAFGEEFAQLYLEVKSGEKKVDRFREKMAQFYRAKGYLHYAKYHTNLFESNRAFLKALTIYPQFSFSRNFWLSVVKRNIKTFPKSS